MQESISSRPLRAPNASNRRYTLGSAQSGAMKRPIPMPSTPRKAQRQSMAIAHISETLRHSVGPQRGTSGSKPIKTATAVPAAQQQHQERAGVASISTKRISTLNPRISVVSSTASAFNSGKQPPSTKLYSDPRNIRDVEFQRRATRDIIDYLIKIGHGPQNTRSLRGISSKDFQNIFKTLHLRIVPTYRYSNRKFEEEIFDVLKQLSYPLADSISPRSLYSIAAPHSFPTFLALLHWLVISCQNVDAILEEAEKEEKRSMDTLFSEFARATYKSFMCGQDDFTPMELELQNTFDKFNEEHVAKIKELEEKKKQLQRQVAAYEDRVSPLIALKGRRKQQEKDKIKYTEYIAEKRKKILQYKGMINATKEEIQQAEEVNRFYESERDKYKMKMDAQAISEEELVQLDESRLQLEKELENYRTRLNQMQVETWEYEMNLEKKRSAIDASVAEFNRMGMGIGIVPSTAAFANKKDFSLVFNPAGKTVGSMLSLDIKGDVLPYLKELYDTHKLTVAQFSDKASAAHDNAENLSADVKQQKLEVEELEQQLLERKTDFDELLESTRQENITLNSVNHDLEKKLREVRDDLNSRLVECDRKESNLRMRIHEIARTAAEEQKQLVDAILNLSRKQIAVITHIQEKAMELKMFVKKQTEGNS
ncbi:kinetochore-associated Ndc80 complex subunit ndc80 [Apophysomyces ossiformis]|uniref:Kinetochore protein NDC80 n=1 Tax=Apophysomyces ossiformis TaxID=679940 RepID=A0A8H7EQ90_9FUNG|nr:kinetochore-associated Ndc80 complex subunit ndc80 [Apophysomyces ossiformis]